LCGPGWVRNSWASWGEAPVALVKLTSKCMCARGVQNAYPLVVCPHAYMAMYASGRLLCLFCAMCSPHTKQLSPYALICTIYASH
jgi:hypothetical protein